MEVVLLLAVLFLLGYPFIAASIAGAGQRERLRQLEREVETLRATVETLRAADITGAPVPAPAAQRAQSAPQRDEIRYRPPVAPAPAPAPRPPEPPTHVMPPAPSAPPATPQRAPEPASEPAPEPTVAAARAPQPAAAEAPAPQPAATSARAPQPEAPAPSTPSIAPASSAPSRPAAPPQPPRWLVAARTWLFTGNLVAKLGLVILFIGIGFLLKYVAATVVVPIEVRLAGVVLADLGLLAWGWRLRTARREIGLPVQGTAIAVLMLVVFGAYQRYALLPAGFAFALLVVLTVFTCVLAVLQDAVWLAAFGITGGFATPLLVSSGQGSHIGLFSYYALLNGGVFWLALKRAWRPLNLIGFAFTFIVGSTWGELRYTPEHYASVQAFLILFFLFYVGIAVAYAYRQQTRLKDYVDVTLVLGTPLLAFGLQVALVKDKPFGLAFSAVALGVFYIGLALALWRHAAGRLRVLVETFGALGAIFGTLAIPFAIDGRWTSAAWALEGAGFVWFGLRRQAPRTWIFGLLLQAGAWIAFVGAIGGLDAQAARESNLWLGFLLLAVCTFVVAVDFRRHADTGQRLIEAFPDVLLAIAAVWLLGGPWAETLLRTSGALCANLLAASSVSTAAVLLFIATRLRWRLANVLAALAQLAGAVGLASFAAGTWNWFDMIERGHAQPLLGVLMIAAAALASRSMMERSLTGRVARHAAMMWLVWAAFWWYVPALNIVAGRVAPYLPGWLGPLQARWVCAYAVAVALSVPACVLAAARLRWERLRWLGAAGWVMLAFVTCDALGRLYGARDLPEPAVWLAWAALWAAGEYLLLRTPAERWAAWPRLLRALHTLRTAGPWLALWPAGGIRVDRWLTDGVRRQAQEAGIDWATDAAWSNYLPTWAMMLAVVWLVRRAQGARWPAAPLAAWYRDFVIPAAAALLLALCGAWNVFQDGGMAPLPYVPLANPLDLTTGFALLLGVTAVRACAAGAVLTRRLLVGLGVLAWVWFNLILLRSAAHYLGIRYDSVDLAQSQFVQAMLSLAWSASALVLMRYAAQRGQRRAWSVGAALLGVVVGKLFLVDLASHGSMARVVSFVGVGLLMLLVGYLAPLPKSGEHAQSIPPAQPET